MTNQRKSGAPRQECAAQVITGSKDHGSSKADRRRNLPIASAAAYPPAGRRHLYFALVESCPKCHHAHRHVAERLGDLMGSVRVGSCGATYRLNVRTLRIASGDAA